jgi:mannitol/fructose-specific phosphotransferase system IIA component (Ntr-type)
VIDEFVSFIFAPLFFASVGLHANFIAAFDWKLVLLVLVIACAGKIIGCFAGARFGGLGRRESWAVAFGMNSRGTMEIILGLLALQYGVIGQPMFVALLIMALFTSMISGPAMQRLLRRGRPARVIDFLLPKAFVPRLSASSAPAAIVELSEVLAAAADLSPRAVQTAVLARERSMSTGLGNGVAVPHAKVYSLSGPFVALGLSACGFDFKAREVQPAHVVFLLLTPRGEPAMQIHLLADIARLFRDPNLSEEALTAASLTELLSLLKSSHPKLSHQPA